MALTSAERRSFQRIVADLRAEDRLFLWQTKVTTRRALWLRRQVVHFVAVWLVLLSAAAAVPALGMRVMRIGCSAIGPHRLRRYTVSASDTIVQHLPRLRAHRQ